MLTWGGRSIDRSGVCSHVTIVLVCYCLVKKNSVWIILFEYLIFSFVPLLSYCGRLINIIVGLGVACLIVNDE